MILALLTFPGGAFAARLFEPRHDAALLAAMDHTFQMDYTGAETALAAVPENIPARPYFTGLAFLSRFQDLGDTAALRRAESVWNRLLPDANPPETFSGDATQLRVYRGLAALQLSYVSSIRGSRLRAASLAWTARGLLLPLRGWAEADAGIAVFDYYRERVLKKIDFLPFVHSDDKLPLKRLEAAIDSSHYLSTGLRMSLFWMRVDRNEIEAALRMTDDFLERYPRNRLARQMKGSALFRGGRLNEARTVYEELLREYAGLRGTNPNYPPVGYFSSVGNLARIYAGLGLKNEAQAKLAEWRRARRSGLEPWLPSSLKKDLEDLKIP